MDDKRNEEDKGQDKGRKSEQDSVKSEDETKRAAGKKENDNKTNIKPGLGEEQGDVTGAGKTVTDGGEEENNDNLGETQPTEEMKRESAGSSEVGEEERGFLTGEKEDSGESEKKNRVDPWEKWGEWRSSKKDRKTGQDGAFARGRGFVEGMVPDGLKKLLYAGIGALVSGEEGARRMASDLSLPKDAAGYLLAQVQSTKRELFRIIAGEIRDFLEGINIGAEIQRILTSLTFEIKMQVRLKPSKNDNGVRPEVKGKVKVLPRKKRRKDQKEE